MGWLTGRARIDHSSGAAFLETANADNVPIHHRRGYDTVAQESAFDDGPTQIFMRREPRQGT